MRSAFAKFQPQHSAGTFVQALYHTPSFKGMTVSSFEAMAGGHGSFGFVVFPHFIKARFTRFASEWTLFQDVSFVVALDFKKAGLLQRV